MSKCNQMMCAFNGARLSLALKTLVRLSHNGHSLIVGGVSLVRRFNNGGHYYVDQPVLLFILIITILIDRILFFAQQSPGSCILFPQIRRAVEEVSPQHNLGHGPDFNSFMSHNKCVHAVFSTSVLWKHISCRFLYAVVLCELLVFLCLSS